jgi:hypothetical protein
MDHLLMSKKSRRLEVIRKRRKKKSHQINKLQEEEVIKLKSLLRKELKRKLLKKEDK